MEESKKIKTLWLAILSLVIINISVLGWISFGHPPADNQPPQPAEIAKRLDFDKSQRAIFQTLKKEHFDQINPIRDDIAKRRERLFQAIKNETLSDSLMKIEIAALAQAIETNEYQTFKHLQKIRTICTPIQKQLFDEEILPLFHKQEPHRPPQHP
jgi:hypothetical protein